MGNLVDQKNDYTQCNESPEKHENEDESENLRLSSRAALQRKQRHGAGTGPKGPKPAGQTNISSIQVSRHNAQSWQLSCSKHRHDPLRLSEVAPGGAVSPVVTSILASP
jgi:hypothetical protein